MSKVISFSISDRYLDKLRSLYPSLTDNLAAKQFLTDRLDGSLGSGLDAILDDGLDYRVKTLIESWVDGLLDERLDATVGKSLTSLSERMARLEERLDGSLDGRLDEMEPLTKEALRLDHLADQRLIDAIESELEETEKDEADYESDTSPLPNQETVEIADTVEPDSIDEPVTGSIGPVRGDSIDTGKGEGMNPNQSCNYLKKKGVKDISYYYLNKWTKDKEGLIPWRGKNARKHLILRDGLYYPIAD